MNSVALFCFPHAGAGPSFFHSWKNAGPAAIDIFPISLPGREKRFNEVPLDQVADAVADALPGLREQAADHTTIALFGHSLGALLAFEAASQLADDPSTPVHALFVSGSASPRRPHRLGATGLPDEAFVDRLQQVIGYRHPALDLPDLREMLLPTLRADIAMHERYAPATDRVLDLPITAVRGARDRLVSAAQCAEWAEMTTGAFAAAELPGDHMYLAESATALLALINGRLLADPSVRP